MLLKSSLLGNPFIIIKKRFGECLNYKTKNNRFLDVLSVFLFGAIFFSIPTFSFIHGFHYITWALTILFILVVFLDLFSFYQIKIDIINISLFLFCVAVFVGSAFSLFKNFTFTYIYLTLFSLLVYTFCSSNKGIIRLFLYSAYFGIICFLIVFIFKYHTELFSANFSRLGGAFGDANDIAIYNCLGAAISIYFLFLNRNFWVKFVSLLLAIAFLYCGFASGSKIIIILLFAIICFLVFYLNGLNKWLLSVFEILIVIAFGIVLLNLPFASELKYRFINMISSLTGKQISGAASYDMSTSMRLSMFANGIEMFLRRPLFGYGANGFSTYSGFQIGWSHNHISEVLCNTGIIGTTLYHIPFFLCFYNFSKKGDSSKVVFLVVLLLFLFSMISIALLSEKMFAFLIGVVYASLVDTRPFRIINKSKSHFNKECTQSWLSSRL